MTNVRDSKSPKPPYKYFLVTVTQTCEAEYMVRAHTPEEAQRNYERNHHCSGMGSDVVDYVVTKVEEAEA